MKPRDKAGGKVVKTQRPKALKRRNAAKVGREPPAVDTAERIALLEHRLNEALEQQAATSEVLQVISSSPGDLQPVFETILENATRICEAKFANLFLYETNSFRIAAQLNAPPAYAERWRRQPTLTVSDNPQNPLTRLVASKNVVAIADLMAERGYIDRDPRFVALVESAGARSHLVVPMLKEDELIGAIVIYRQEVHPFTVKEIELVRNFAAQAVIAIENTRLLSELRQRTDDLSESLEQQTATSEVLKVISSSPGQLEPVFNAMLANATQLCEATFGTMYLYDADGYRAVATHNAPTAYAEVRARNPKLRPPPDVPLGRIVITKETAQIADIKTTQSYIDHDPFVVAAADGAGYRTVLAVPMLKEQDLIGAIAIQRQEVRLFNDKQIELVKNFAAQAVIAIENTRLLSELRESLEQQTATSEVLKVISSSPGELKPVFNAILASALRICEAKFGVLMLHHGDGSFDTRVTVGAPPALVDALTRQLFTPLPGNPLDRMLRSKKTVHVVDAAAEKVKPLSAQLAGARSHISVPMVKENEVVGAVSIYRTEVRPFTDKQIELVTNFAAQAVIAIENARLLNELRQRTDDLSESLEQQTATSEVLKVISTSPGELEPVFNAMLKNAVGICGARFGSLILFEEDAYRRTALYNAPPAFLEQQAKNPLRPMSDSPTLTRVAETKKAVQITDMRVEQPDEAIAKLGGARTVLCVPMLRDGRATGALSIYRQEVRPFTERQVELVQNFAAQAVIAIENTRLLNELRESLQQQTATADVLGVMSRSAFDLQPIFETVAESAVRLCGADKAIILRFDGELLHTVVAHNASPELAEFMRQNPIRPDRGSTAGRAALERRTTQIADVMADPEYTYGSKAIDPLRTVLAVPMVKGDELLGVILTYRLEVKPFSEKQIALVETFADQAAIAIENVRLFEEVKKRTEELTESLQQQTATADVLKVISRSTFDLQTVLQTLVESAARLCDADKTIITRQKNGVFYRAEAYGFSLEFLDHVRNIPIKAERGSGFGRALLEGRAVHIPDVKADPEYTLVEGQRLGDYRTVLTVPMLREGVPTGVLSLTRSEVRPFTEKQIELASTFADQAAIAIENVRLFESVEARTRELAQSLEDLRTTQDRLVQTQKLASLGQLTAGIAHEIKNPLNFVNNFSTVSSELVDELQDTVKGLAVDDKARKQINELTTMLRGNLDKVVQHGKRADAIVKNMLLHSREGSGEHRPVDINALVEEGLNLAYHGARAEKQGFNITLERSFDPTTGEADVFPQDITRALLNLILNGFYAATKRKAEVNGGDYEPILAAATKNLGDRVEIKIRDNGTGIPPEVKEKIFNPFFTTKPAGEGTGLGLSISHDIIVKQHGGSIDVDTLPGEFTEIRVILPRATAFLSESKA